MISGSPAQPNGDSSAATDRKPAVAGKFYPGAKEELENMLSGFFRLSSPVLNSQPIALIVPHAGYVFSGSVAASAFSQIDPDRDFAHVFIIGSSHTTFFEGVSVYTKGHFITPLGKIPVDELASRLHEQYALIHNDMGPHIREHGIEVQLPFLQFWLKKPFSIIPMIVGGESARTSKCLAETLGPYFNENNLFVVSTDFSHYPPYKNACVSDKFMADAIALNDVKAFLRAKSENESGIIPNLMTAMCGWTSVLTLLNITEKDPDLTYTKILYKNSGDSPYGDKDRVVGYCSFGITKKTGKASKQDLSMADEEKSWLLRIARESLEGYFKKNKFVIPSECQSLPGLRTRCGAFVTLKENGKLRGCIGNMHSDIPLCELVRDLTVAAATRDFRFDPVNNDEMQAIEIEISILGPMRKITTIEEIQLGKHGIYIRNGNQTGTFLPQVAVSTGWTVNEFLGHCARDKALIGWNGWKEAEIYIYETLCFCEREHEHLVN